MGHDCLDVKLNGHGVPRGGTPKKDNNNHLLEVAFGRRDRAYLEWSPVHVTSKLYKAWATSSTIEQPLWFKGVPVMSLFHPQNASKLGFLQPLGEFQNLFPFDFPGEHLG